MNEEPKIPSDGVVNPAVPSMTPVPEPVPPKRRKSKMQLIIVLIVVFLMLVAVGLWWYFIYNKPAEEQPAQDQAETVQPITNVPNHFIQMGNEVGYINENGDYKEFLTLTDTEEVVEAINVDGNPELRYVDTKDNTEGSKELIAYGKINETGKVELFKFPAGTNGYFSNPILSPDGSKVVVEKSDPTSGDMIELTAITVADGVAKKVYDPSTRGGLYYSVDWVDQNTILLQSQTCRNCDGPFTSELTKLNISDGKISSFYKGPSTLEFANFLRVPGSEALFVFGGDFVMGLDPGYGLGPYESYKINKSTGVVTKIIEIQEDDIAGLVGWTSDEQGLFIDHTGAVKTDGENADIQNETDNYNELPPKVWIAKNGSKTDLAFVSEFIVKDSFINNVFEEGGNTYIIVEIFNSSDSNETTTTVRLLRKKGASETTDMLVEVNSKPNKGGVFHASSLVN